MKKKYTEKIGLSNKNMSTLNLINEILEEYVSDGYRLTLRQLYYQLVSRDVIPNNDKEYAKLSHILKCGRMSGVVDWSAIEDRIRVPKIPYWVDDVTEAISDIIDQYRLNRMQGQRFNIEVWVEKDALSNVLYRVTKKYHVRLMVNRGYSSISAMHEASNRLNNGDYILYFGDHDPSGLDMVRDVKDRLIDFKKDVNVIPVALNMEQIKKFSPPPNPAKISDPRAAWYIEKYGVVSWELDALPPKELIKLTEESILKLIDIKQYNKMLDKEKEDIKRIKTITKS